MNAASRPAKSGLTSGEDANHKERDVGPQAQNGALRSAPGQQVTQCVITGFCCFFFKIKGRSNVPNVPGPKQTKKNTLSGG